MTVYQMKRLLMHKIITISIAASFIIFIASCGHGKKDKDAAITEAKLKVEKLKAEKTKTEKELKKAEDNLAKIDTSNHNTQKPKLVAVQELQLSDFNHFIELQGRVDASNISYIAPHGAPGSVKAIFIKKGDYIRKGQLLLKLEDAIARQNVATVKQNIGALKTQLTLAQSVYQRQKNLWDQNIGTEVQLLQAKTNAQTLENQIRAVQENVKTAQEQLNLSNIYSDVNGVADDVNIRIGETFTGLSPVGAPQIKIVNNASLKVTANIPENYLNSVKLGTDVIIQIPDINRSVNTKVSFVGSAIDVSNRGFVVEAKLPASSMFKPNQIALVKIKDYQATAALAVPLAILQNDEKGKFVMVASKENGKMFARKRMVSIGFLNGDMLEIKTGLQKGDTIITGGFQSLYDGQLITV